MPTGDGPTYSPQEGFAYILLLLVIALVSIAATASVQLGATMARREAERELLAIGSEFQQALHNYAGVTAHAVPPREGRGPKSLDELLKDPRVPGVRRHLRRLYPDPLTGKSEWGLVLDLQGRITGVYSLADGTPIQQAGFEPLFASFEGADTYRQWVFGPAVAKPQPAPSRR